MPDLRRERSLPTTAGVLVGLYLAISVLLIAIGLLMTHVLLHGAVGRWDDRVIASTIARRSPGWNRLSGDATFLANTLGIVVVGGLATLVVLIRRRTRWALLLVVGLVIELTGFLSVNYAVKRPRPMVPHLGSTPSTYSWPSGHVAATVVLYGGIAVLVMKATRKLAPVVFAWLVALLLTVAVGASRVYRAEHHPTDVLAGLALGIMTLTGVTYALNSYRGSHKPTESTTALASPGRTP